MLQRQQASPAPGFARLHFQLARMAAPSLHINQLPDDLLLRILAEALSDAETAGEDIQCAAPVPAAAPLRARVVLLTTLPACIA